MAGSARPTGHDAARRYQRRQRAELVARTYVAEGLPDPLADEPRPQQRPPAPGVDACHLRRQRARPDPVPKVGGEERTEAAPLLVNDDGVGRIAPDPPSTQHPPEQLVVLGGTEA